jgi:hypothetical protein
VNVPPRKLTAFIWTAALAVLALAVACGGGGDDNTNDQTGHLTDPQNVPTATMWPQLPNVIILDPNNVQPLPTLNPNNGASPTPTAAPGEPGVCGQTYTIESGDTMFGIADKCGVSEPDLEAANAGVDPHSLVPGDVLTLPAKPTDTPTQ